MSNPVFLIEIDPLPKSCIDANDDGIFVLTGKTNEYGQFIVDLSTVSKWKEPNDEELYPLRPDVKKRLEEVSQELEIGLPSHVPFMTFMEQSKAVFCELKNILIRERAQLLFVDEEWPLDQVLNLQLQLSDLESQLSGTNTSIHFLSEDLNQLTIQHFDSSGRSHPLDLHLKNMFSHGKIHATALWGPWVPDTTILCDIVQQYVDVVHQHQRAYQELDDIDEICNNQQLQHQQLQQQPTTTSHQSLAFFQRCIQIPYTSTTILVTLESITGIPKSIQFMGGQRMAMEEQYNKFLWSNDLSVISNLEQALSVKLVKTTVPPCVIDTSTDCAICYSAVVLDKAEPCENEQCGRFYHNTCLHEWLQSLPTARISFDRVIGLCPYCQEPISVALV